MFEPNLGLLYSLLVPNPNTELPKNPPVATSKRGFSGLNLNKVAFMLLVPTGILMIRSSGQTWIELSVFDFKGTAKWYGKVTLASGIIITLLGSISIFPSASSRLKNFLSWAGIMSSLISISILIAISIKLEQISQEIERKARSPERFFDGTFLEGLGEALADISAEISVVIKPQLASGWRTTTILSVIALLICIITRFSSSPPRT